MIPEPFDEIRKSIALKAPVSRVWTALTDHEAFGRWFRVTLDRPFAVGAPVIGTTEEGDLEWHAWVEQIEPEHHFCFSWYPLDVPPGTDVKDKPRTTVRFYLVPTQKGCELTVIETGFSAFEDKKALDILRQNAAGWTAQLENIKAYVSG